MATATSGTQPCAWLFGCMSHSSPRGAGHALQRTLLGLDRSGEHRHSAEATGNVCGSTAHVPCAILVHTCAAADCRGANNLSTCTLPSDLLDRRRKAINLQVVPAARRQQLSRIHCRSNIGRHRAILNAACAAWPKQRYGMWTCAMSQPPQQMMPMKTMPVRSGLIVALQAMDVLSVTKCSAA